MSRRRFGVPLSFYLGSAIIFLVAVISIIVVIKNLTLPVDPKNGTTQEFEIEKGESVRSVASRLQDAHLVRSSLGFRIVVKQAGLDNNIQAGVYELSPAMFCKEVARSLTRGMKDLKVTIPEGFRIEQIAETVQDALSIPTQEFITAAGDNEGYLFPDTYFVAKGTSAAKIVETMKATFNKKTANLSPTKSDIILASLVERETKGDAEKPVVAGILKKRLAAGWPLQLDATIQYIAGNSSNWWPNTTLLDRKRPSLYNTYLNQGLPPAPICNPGLESIKAVMGPQSSDYWYYLHDSNGVIHFAKTEAEHEANIAKFIR